MPRPGTIRPGSTAAATHSIRGIEDGAGLPLGIAEDLDVLSEDLQLLPGDSIVLYTDGITEALAANRERASSTCSERSIRMPRFSRAMGGRTRSSRTSTRSLFAHTQARTRADDQTLVALQYVGPDRCIYPPIRRGV